MSIYELKPRFQALLRPAVKRLHAAGVTANQVTLAACAVSLLLGIGLYGGLSQGLWPVGLMALIPLWMLLRMAFNAVDGMLAREFGQQSRLGAFLNELTDVVSDAALYLPFAALPPFTALWVGVVIVLAGLSEFAGALGPTVGASRRYDGPMGKSDRAFVIGLIGVLLAPGWIDGAIVGWIAWAAAALCVLTSWRRVRQGLAEIG